MFQSDDAVNPDRLYDLVAVVIHCGSGPNRGHYISIVKSHGFWLLFDDDMVDVSNTGLISSLWAVRGTKTDDLQNLGYVKFTEDTNLG
jgi:ubiquitin carboxyl-terminal hydrolase 12/46